ncbi:MAG: 4Fe-4S binding protein [Candidatus Omnitrophica bacterium]|nr:4Fe-4S binding protein [Candidatus Omnitrophota bacterium]
MTALLSGSAFAVERFPPPDFDPGYKMPVPTMPAPRAIYLEYLDVAVLLAALSLSVYLVLRKRSRSWILGLMLFSLAYFGFWRKGCVCAIGSIQDVMLALFDNGYAVPLTVVAFFLLPLVFTLFFGRTFCAAVCPIGAIQDVMLVRPIKVRPWLEHALGIVPFFYLGAAVLFAATGSGFIICQYDPFVSFFRRSGSVNMLAIGAGFLLVGLIVGRPYCRFLCPYGALLRVVSRFSKWNVTLTPEDCIKCQLCDVACPFGAIREPGPALPEGKPAAPSGTGIEEGNAGPSIKKQASAKAMIGWGVLTVLLMVSCGWLGARSSGFLSYENRTVALAERVAAEAAGKAFVSADTVVPSTVRLSASEQREENLRLASQAFRQTGQPVDELYAAARVARNRFKVGGWLLGAFVGLVIGIKLISLSILPDRTIYEPDRANCVACGRCYTHCPREQVRVKRMQRGKTNPAIPA